MNVYTCIFRSALKELVKYLSNDTLKEMFLILDQPKHTSSVLKNLASKRPFPGFTLSINFHLFVWASVFFE